MTNTGILFTFAPISHEEIKRYFESTPPPEQVEWKPWAKITDSKLFLESCYIGIRNFNGPPEMCPALWHLKDFYQHVKRNLSDTTKVQQG